MAASFISQPSFIGASAYHRRSVGYHEGSDSEADKENRPQSRKKSTNSKKKKLRSLWSDMMIVRGRISDPLPTDELIQLLELILLQTGSTKFGGLPSSKVIKLFKQLCHGKETISHEIFTYYANSIERKLKKKPKRS